MNTPNLGAWNALLLDFNNNLARKTYMDKFKEELWDVVVQHGETRPYGKGYRPWCCRSTNEQDEKKISSSETATKWNCEKTDLKSKAMLKKLKQNIVFLPLYKWILWFLNHFHRKKTSWLKESGRLEWLTRLDVSSLGITSEIDLKLHMVKANRSSAIVYLVPGGRHS